jgi:hypothetical protein
MNLENRNAGKDAAAQPVPMGFDFGSALNPDYVIKCSYGNDSIALIQWMHEYNQKHPLGKVVVLYNNTGWSAKWWAPRVEHAETSLVLKYGFVPARTTSLGMRRLVLEKNCWPNSHMKFCTEQLKIMPTMAWLREHDPEGKAVMVCGVRREESWKRSLWPEWVESSDKNEGRSDWSPLVHYREEERDALIVRAGWAPLPHRSRECRCVLANANDLATWKESDIEDIEALEAELGAQKHSRGNDDPLGNRYMFRPSVKAGNPKGIREVVRWAHGVIASRKDKNEPDSEPVGCDSGYCGG